MHPILTSMASLAAIGATLSFMPIAGSDDADPRLELQHLVDALAVRRANFGRISVEGHVLRANVTKEGGTKIRDALSALVDGLPRSDAETFLMRLPDLIPFRECHRYRLAADVSTIVIDRIRDSALDNSAEWLRAQMPANGSPVADVAQERIFVAATDELTIQDRYYVSRSSQPCREAILRSVDLSLVDWSPLLLDERHPVGQRRWVDHPSASPNTDVLVYESGRGKETLRTEYSFDRMRGERPIRVSMQHGGENVMTLDFLYDPTEPFGLPTATLRIGSEAPTGGSNVELYVFARTRFGSAVTIPERRVPAIRIELQRSDDGRSAMLRQILPATIEATPPERRLAVAIAQLLDHWGEHGEEFDFDGDGEIGPGDMDRANETL